jgi:hypothetical protein
VPILSTTNGSGSGSASSPVWLPVCDSEFRLHQKRGDPNAPPTLSVEHVAGFSPYSEYVSFESVNTYALSFAHRWWRAMGGRSPVPMSVAESIVRRSELGRVTELQISREGQFWRISRRRVQRLDGTLFEIDSKYKCSRITAPEVSPETASPEAASPSQAPSEINAASTNAA